MEYDIIYVREGNQKHIICLYALNKIDDIILAIKYLHDMSSFIAV
jgi:hypothetical protein